MGNQWDIRLGRIKIKVLGCSLISMGLSCKPEFLSSWVPSGCKGHNPGISVVCTLWAFWYCKLFLTTPKWGIWMNTEIGIWMNTENRYTHHGQRFNIFVSTFASSITTKNMQSVGVLQSNVCTSNTAKYVCDSPVIVTSVERRELVNYEWNSQILITCIKVKTW